MMPLSLLTLLPWAAYLALSASPASAHRLLARRHFLTRHVRSDRADLVNRANQAEVFKPVIADNFPDPCVIRDERNKLWRAFATNGNGVNVQMAESAGDDLHKPWTLKRGYDALPRVGKWVDKSDVLDAYGKHSVWAPHVHHLTTSPAPAKPYIMYYSATPASNPQFHCVGIARAAQVEGQYEPDDAPWQCALAYGGAIDASAFYDTAADKMYVVYKGDGNAIDLAHKDTSPWATPIFLVEVDKADGSTLVPSFGKAVVIFDDKQTKQDDMLVEAPQIVRSAGGKYFLFYSSGSYANGSYKAKYAVADNIKGPYVRAAGGALFETQDRSVDPKNGILTQLQVKLNGPGGAEFDPASGLMLFHHVQSENPLVRPTFAVKIELGDSGSVKIVDWYGPTA